MARRLLHLRGGHGRIQLDVTKCRSEMGLVEYAGVKVCMNRERDPSVCRACDQMEKWWDIWQCARMSIFRASACGATKSSKRDVVAAVGVEGAQAILTALGDMETVPLGEAKWSLLGPRVLGNAVVFGSVLSQTHER